MRLQYFCIIPIRIPLRGLVEATAADLVQYEHDTVARLAQW